RRRRLSGRARRRLGHRSARGRDAVRAVILVERARRARDQAVKCALLLGGIFEGDVAPSLAAAGEHRLAIEDAVVLEPGGDEPVRLAPQIGHLLAFAEADLLD